MKGKVISSVLLSLVLIVGAFVVRSSKAPNGLGPELVSVHNEAGDFEIYNIQDFFLTSTPTSQLSMTDMVGRSLITDYIGLAKDDKLTEENVAALMNYHIENLKNINKANKIDSSSLKIVEDSQINFQNYSDITTSIEKERQKSVRDYNASTGSFKKLGVEVYSFATNVSSAYDTAINKMMGVPVPESLITYHMELINNFISTSTGLKSIANTELDSTASLAGLSLVDESIKQEGSIINQIIAVLIKNGAK
jgi:hypothetical protein